MRSRVALRPAGRAARGFARTLAWAMPHEPGGACGRACPCHNEQSPDGNSPVRALFLQSLPALLADRTERNLGNAIGCHTTDKGYGSVRTGLILAMHIFEGAVVDRQVEAAIAA